ncbi:EscU/YscU/HrcU family type III secretion system export apparatus switch protein [Novosphingobium album (ex Liu et al. 2023)]|uniref:EscU/YscU/HrcU family type III secretion system export apparatus switch protein n=1 Tax=Novosphingobium album (ex Liu et al. 2023) TaxID=3031130 RepID=A0ABT5WM63_9SPHN|nr:EscU/YscU/HrcU family type III secretion system export apparatus switch protein [Novosphingobium album (ex Liu et al. 2023)]MDE8651122.1 EscU/YscU/HrcU family type III secretion system export apparatus switch protein [Novosphingobium album (ex Liu et al. 2023)]
MSDDGGEKSFAPSAKRKQDAARKGDVLRSRELATAATTLVGATWLLVAGPWVLGLMADGLRAGFTWDRAAIDDFAPGRLLLSALIAALPPVFVLGVGVLAASLVSQLGFGEGRWVGGNMAPKASRLNPLSGLQRMFGPTGWIEMAKGLAKVGLLGTIAWVWGRDRIATLAGLGRGDLTSQLAWGWHAIITLLFALSAGLIMIALIDLPVQWVRRMMRLKMSHQEMRDEHKEMEGSPERKAAIKDRQRKIAMGGLVPAMKEAQFVITNPTHFAVALAYDPARASAPIVLAKGRGDKALAMRELAAEYAVPVLEYPALARSVFYTTREKQVIREELYVAVAAILAFVLSLKRGEKPLRPQVDVPVILRFDTEGRLDPSAIG